MVAYSTWSPPTQMRTWWRCSFSSLILYTIASHFPIINLCQLWKNSPNSWGFPFSINYLSTVYKDTQIHRYFSSSTLALIWCHNSLGNKEWCQRFPSKVPVWEGPKLLEFFRLASLWGNCGSPHLWDGFVSKSWPTHRRERRQNLHNPQPGAYIARGYPTLFSHSHNEEKRCPYVLHSSLGNMVYFASSPICIKKWARFKVVTKVDDAQTFRHSLVLPIQRECYHCWPLWRIP